MVTGTECVTVGVLAAVPVTLMVKVPKGVPGSM